MCVCVCVCVCVRERFFSRRYSLSYISFPEFENQQYVKMIEKENQRNQCEYTKGPKQCMYSTESPFSEHRIYQIMKLYLIFCCFVLIDLEERIN